NHEEKESWVVPQESELRFTPQRRSSPLAASGRCREKALTVSCRPDLMGQETPQPLGRRAFFACFLVFFTTGIAVQIRGVLGNVFFSVRRNSLSQLTFSRFN
ncbi:MAG TPA: hypothetical protein VG125_23350, partial [Pirellulales bacterium]|nr:hypothetical protein [Pirellulales bacterium]